MHSSDYDNDRPAILIATGGTAGHVRPALAVAAAYGERLPGATILFAGAGRGFEESLVKAAGHEFFSVASAPFAGVGMAARIAAAGRLRHGIGEAAELLRAHRVALVLGFGGYASVPAMLAAWRAGVPTASFECNATPGGANVLLAPFSRRVLLGMAECWRYFPGRHRAICGVPLVDPPARRSFDALPPAPKVAVLGGSLGAAFLNERAPEFAAALRLRGIDATYFHQAGESGVEATRAAYARRGIAAEVVGYCDGMKPIYETADFVIAAAGASTIFEIASAGLPCLLVPARSVAWNHQERNARATGLWWTSVDAWDSTAVAERVASVFSDLNRLRQCASASARLARPDAALRVVEACEELRREAAGGRRGG